MKMRDEDGIDLSKVYVGAAELHLSPLTTIHHKALATHLYDLGRSTMFEGGQRTATPQDSYFKRFHTKTPLLLALECIDALMVLQHEAVWTEFVNIEGILVEQEFAIHDLP